MAEPKRMLAGEIADVTWPTSTWFRIEGSRPLWKWVDRTPTRVRLSRFERMPNLRNREVRKYIAPETPMEVIDKRVPTITASQNLKVIDG